MIAVLLATTLTLTNVVGRALTGEYVRSTDQAVTIRVGKSERTIPFAALAPGERERILKAHGQLPLSPKEKRVQAHLEQELSVIDAKEKGGWLSKETAERRRAAERRNAEFQLK